MVESAQAFDRTVELPHIAGKGDKGAQTQCPIEHFVAADPPDYECADRSEKCHQWAEEAARFGRAQFAFEQRLAAAFELVDFAVFLGKSLYYAHAGYHIGKQGANAGPTPPQRSVNAF